MPNSGAKRLNKLDNTPCKHTARTGRKREKELYGCNIASFNRNFMDVVWRSFLSSLFKMLSVPGMCWVTRKRYNMIQSNDRTVTDKGKIEELGEKPVTVPYYELSISTLLLRRSQLPRGLRRRSAAVRLLRLRVGIPSGARTFVCSECCVLSDRGLCDKLVTCPEESYRVVRRCVWSRNIVNEEALAHWRAVAPKTNKQNITTMITLPNAKPSNIFTKYTVMKRHRQ